MPQIISIIDDDAWARDGIKDLVDSLGYDTRAFASAEEFLRSDCVEATACIISDVQMPGLSGLDLQDCLRSRRRAPPIILVTAFPDEKRYARALDAGVLGFLVKPFDDKCLVKFLTAAVGAPN